MLQSKKLNSMPLVGGGYGNIRNALISVGHRNRGFFFNLLNDKKMETIEKQKAINYLESAKELGYNFDRLFECIIHDTSPENITSTLIDLIFEISRIMTNKDFENCFTDDMICLLKLLFESFKYMTDQKFDGCIIPEHN